MSEAEHARRGTTAWAFLPVLVVLLACYLQRPGETDLWWHLRTGAWMVEHGEIPRVDPFSLTRAGAPWTNFEWLYQLGVHGLYAAGGLSLVVLGHAALALIGFAGALRAGAPGTSASARALAGTLAACTQFLYAFARPQAVTVALTGVYLALLGERQRMTAARAAVVVAMQVVWVNCHGGYVFGLLMLILWAVERSRVDGWAKEERRREARRAWALVLAAAAATLANPYGFHLLTHGVTELRSSYAAERIVEWRATFALPPAYAAPHVLTVFALGLVLAMRQSGRPRRLFCWLVLVVWGLAALRSARLITLFTLVATPALAEALDSPTGAPRRGRQRVLLAGAVALAFAWLAGSGRLQALTAGTGRPGLVLDEDRVPAGSVAFLQQAAATGAIFHTYADGSYLIGAAPTLPALVDPRSALFGDALLYQVDAALQDVAAFRDLDRVHCFNWVLLPRNTASQRACLTRLLEARWRLVYADARDCVLARPGQRPDLPDRQPDLLAQPLPAGEPRPAKDFPLVSPWRAFWRLAPVNTSLREHGWFTLYRLVGHPARARHHLARYLEEAPPFGFYYEPARAAYAGLAP